MLANHRTSSAFRRIALALALSAGVTGCASDLRQAIVATRNHQGDAAFANRSYSDAALAYRLALQLAPQDEHARAGLAQVQLELAGQLYEASKFDDALQALEVAAKYDPQSVRLAALRSDIEGARVKREIVVSNYPTYRETGSGLRRSYAQLKIQNGLILAALQRFDYTYDSGELTKAIRASFELNEEVGRLTARLINYRRSVESGSAPGSDDSAAASGGSLLPLP
jgi:tetratricopeptide (TPR) repeat protein